MDPYGRLSLLSSERLQQICHDRHLDREILTRFYQGRPWQGLVRYTCRSLAGTEVAAHAAGGDMTEVVRCCGS
jgi:hypothetical protein